MTPADLADQLDGFQIRFAQPALPVQKLSYSLSFTEQLLSQIDSESSARPFLLELSENFGSVIPDCDLIGCSPHFFEYGQKIFLRASKLLDSDEGSTLFESFADTMLMYQATLLGLIGSFDKLAKVLNARLPDPSNVTIEERPKILLDLVRVHRPSWTERVLEKVNSWLRVSRSYDRDILFPVVVTSLGENHPSAQQCSYLRSVHFQILGVNKFSDEVEVPSSRTDTRDQKKQDLDRVLSGARMILGEASPNALKVGYKGLLALSNSELNHAGRSASVAMATSIVTEVQRFRAEKIQFHLKECAAFTGDLEASGEITDVLEAGFERKVESAFFSPVVLFVVPRSQIAAATVARDRLHEEFPYRNLQVLGISSLSDLFSDRRIMSEIRRGWIRHILHRIWNRRTIAFPVALLLALVGSVFWNQYSRPDPHPTNIAATETGLSIRNADNIELWHIPLSELDREKAVQKGTLQHWTLADLNADGFNDVVYMHSGQSQAGGFGTLTAIDGRSNRVLWDRQGNVEVEYPEDPVVETVNMAFRTLLAGEMDAEPGAELIVLVQQDFYPAVLARIDPADGSIMSRYDHPGLLYQVYAEDLDLDGQAEIVAIGTNNAFKQAVLIALDLDRIDGVGPAQGTYRNAHPPGGNERAYLRFPTTVIFDEFTNQNPMGVDLRFDHSTDLMLLHIYEGVNYLNERAYMAFYIAQLDYDLTVRSIGSNDTWDNLYSILRDDGKVSVPFDNLAKETLMDGIEQWTKDGWKPMLRAE